jgi:hypothetical protein
LSHHVNYCHTRYCFHSCPEKISAEAHQNIAARANQKKIAVESHQNIAVKSCPEKIAAEAHQILLSKPSREIAAKSQQNIAAKAAPKKHGTIPGKTKAAKTADGIILG